MVPFQFEGYTKMLNVQNARCFPWIAQWIARGMLCLFGFFSMTSWGAHSPSSAIKKTSVPPQVTIITSILPLQLLVQDLLDGVDARWVKTSVLVPPDQLPHDYPLKTSDLKSLVSADIVVWVSPMMESFLPDVLSQNPHMVSISIDQLPGAVKSRRLDQDVELDDHNNKKKDGMALAEHDDHHHHHGHGDSDGHLVHDPHLWLSPKNMELLVEALAKKLTVRFESMLGTASSAEDTELKNVLAMLRKNQYQAVSSIRAEVSRIKANLVEYKSKPYWVFHDGYGYFEEALGLSPSAVVTPAVNKPVGIKHVLSLKKQMSTQKIQCVFVEPQLDPRILNTIDSNNSLPRVVIDPMGSQLSEQNTFCRYCDYLQSLGQSYLQCLSHD